METETLAFGRDLALILLALEAALLALPLLVIPFYILRYLPRVTHPLRPNLRRVKRKSMQVERVTKFAMGMVVQPFVWTAAAATALRRGLGYAIRRR